MVAGYFIIASLSIYFNTTFFLIYWFIPRILGEPFLRLVRMVEHTGKDETADMIHNTRTSFPSFFLKFLYWNMPYHVEHHLYASVPFYKLPKFHKLIKPHTDELEPSILAVHLEILKQIDLKKFGVKLIAIETHHVDGDIEPVVLCYAVIKSPELNNPLDPESGETGNTLYGITEIYNGPEGAQAHMELGQSRESMFSDLVSLTNEYCVAGILGAPIIRSM